MSSASTCNPLRTNALRATVEIHLDRIYETAVEPNDISVTIPAGPRSG